MNEHSPELRRNAESTDRLRALVGRLDEGDLRRSLGGGWTVGFALAHLAFWDARQHFALQIYARGQAFPAEDKATNDTLAALAPLLRADVVGAQAVRASELVDATLASLPAAERESLVSEGLGFAIERWRHRDDHIAQIEVVLS